MSQAAVAIDVESLGETALDVWRAWRSLVPGGGMIVVARTSIGAELAWGMDHRRPEERTPTGLRLERLTGASAIPLTAAEVDQVFGLLSAGRLTIGMRRTGWRFDPANPYFDLLKVFHRATGKPLP